MTIDLHMPQPYNNQIEIARHPAKRKVIAAGRRAGKTILGARMAVGGDVKNGFDCGLLDGKRVLLSSTSQDQSDVFWEYIVNWLAPLLNKSTFYKNEVKRIIRLGSGQIRVKTGRNPDALRADYADLLILDECAYLEPRAWTQVGAPMMADSDGNAVFFSTPKRRNWFWQMFVNGSDPDNHGWESWQFPSTANPHLSHEAFERLAEDMTEDDYKQEILAQFLEGAGAVFRYVDERCTAQIRDYYYSPRFVFGIDWAQVSDYTVIVVLDTSTNTVVDYDRFNGVDWSLQRGRVVSLYDKWKPDSIIAEENSIGGPNIEALQAEGLPVQPFMTTAKSKSPLIESLVLAFERGEITCLNDPIIKGELMSYERKISSTGRSQYSAPPGMHDDTVIALALAWHGATHGILERYDSPLAGYRG